MSTTRKMVRLSRIARHIISATTTPFVCDETLADIQHENFRPFLLGKREEAQPKHVVVSWNLDFRLKIFEIINQELPCPVAEAKVRLRDIDFLKSRQADGEEGALLVNGLSNLFFVEGNKRVLYLVSLLHRQEGWDMGCCVASTCIHTFSDDCRLFLPASVVAP